jgi:hypothetical protein
MSGVAFGFRPWNLAVPVLMLLAYFVISSGLSLPTAATALALAAFREDMILWILLILLVAWARGHIDLLSASGVAILPLVWSAVALLVLLPAASPTGTYLYSGVLRPLGLDTPASLPWLAIRLIYLAIPFGIAAMWANRRTALLTVAAPLIGLSLKGGFASTPFFHYDMPFIPLLLLVLAVGDIQKLSGRTVAVGIVAMSVLLGPLRLVDFAGIPRPLKIDSTVVSTWRKVDEATASYLRPGGSAALPSLLVPRYAERSQITIFPYPFDAPMREPYAMDCPLPDVVVTPPNVPWPTPGWAEASTHYSVVFQIDDFTGYARKDPAESGACKPASEAPSATIQYRLGPIGR